MIQVKILQRYPSINWVIFFYFTFISQHVLTQISEMKSFVIHKDEFVKDTVILIHLKMRSKKCRVLFEFKI
jgi:hypothetical protein